MSKQQIVRALSYIEKQMEMIEDAKYRVMRLKRKVLMMAREYNNASGSTSGRTERAVRRRLRVNNNNNNTPPVRRRRRNYPW